MTEERNQILVKSRSIADGNARIQDGALKGSAEKKMHDEQNYLCFAPNVLRASHKESQMGCRSEVRETGN